MVSIKQIKYALVLNQTRHFSKAAKLCAVSQSTLSSAIVACEKQLGIQLFERDNKKVLVTQTGQIWIKQAGLIYQQLEDLNQSVKQYENPLSAPMRLGVIPTISPYLLPKVMSDIRHHYPKLPLLITELESHKLVEMVQSGELDTAILALPYQTKGLHAFPFWQEDFFVVMHQDNPLAKLNSMTASQLKNNHLMLLPEAHCLSTQTLAMCHFKPDEQDKSFEATSLHTIVQMVASNLGITVIPEISLDYLLSNMPQLKAIRLDEPSPHRELAFICRLHYAGTDGISQLMRTMQTSLETSIKR